MYYFLLAIFITSIIVMLISMLNIINYLTDRDFFNTLGSHFYRWDFVLVYKNMTEKEFGKTSLWFYSLISSLISGFVSGGLIGIFYS